MDEKQPIKFYEKMGILRETLVDSLSLIVFSSVASHAITRLNFARIEIGGQEGLYKGMAWICSFMAAAITIRMFARAMKDRVWREIDIASMDTVADIALEEDLVIMPEPAKRKSSRKSRSRSGSRSRELKPRREFSRGSK